MIGCVWEVDEGFVAAKTPAAVGAGAVAGAVDGSPKIVGGVVICTWGNTGGGVGSLTVGGGFNVEVCGDKDLGNPGELVLLPGGWLPCPAVACCSDFLWGFFLGKESHLDLLGIALILLASVGQLSGMDEQLWYVVLCFGGC